MSSTDWCRNQRRSPIMAWRSSASTAIKKSIARQRNRNAPGAKPQRRSPEFQIDSQPQRRRAMSRIERGSLIGIDVGGTFTDCVLAKADGSTVVEKTFTTPGDPSRGVLDGLEKLAARAGLSLEGFLATVVRIMHGTTITTNAVLTGRGAKIGFITTEGFRDVLLMRRGVREEQFNSECAPPPPLVPRSSSFTVAERVDSDGREKLPLDRRGARAVVGTLKQSGVEAVAVSFLFSFLNPAHELEIAEILKEDFPAAHVSLSTQVLPQLRAYERHSAT